MSSHADLVHRVAAAIIGFARRPSKWLLLAAAVTLGVFTALAILILNRADGFASWIPLILAGLMAVPVIMLAVRRQRLLNAIASVGQHRVVHIETPGEVITAGHDEGSDPLAGHLGVFATRLTGGTHHGRGWFPNVSAVQSVLLNALGGTVNAPYLRDDLSLTFAVAVATLIVVPLAAGGSVILLIIALLV